MASRKNLFVIGRRPGHENQLTEMLAYLLQEDEELLGRWLAGIARTITNRVACCALAAMDRRRGCAGSLPVQGSG